jgi:hypothetical protein
VTVGADHVQAAESDDARVLGLPGAEPYVGPAACHVRRYRHRAGAPRAGDELGLSLVVDRVEHPARDPRGGRQTRTPRQQRQDARRISPDPAAMSRTTMLSAQATTRIPNSAPADRR